MNIEDVRIGMMVRFNPIIGEKHDQNIYCVLDLGWCRGRHIVILDWKSDEYVDVRAISPATQESGAEIEKKMLAP